MYADNNRSKVHEDAFSCEILPNADVSGYKVVSAFSRPKKNRSHYRTVLISRECVSGYSVLALKDITYHGQGEIKKKSTMFVIS